jgi:hypothetical protein
MRITIRSAGLALLSLALATTAATAQDRVFEDEDVERMKAYTVANATGKLYKSSDCLETINRALRTLFNEPQMRLGSTVDLSMGVLQAQNKAAPTVVFDYVNENGRNTTGVTPPETLRTSIWDGLLELAGDGKGYSVFGLSILDGNHSVLLVMDTHGATPTVFWLDQWSSKGGWKEYPTKADLDGEIEYRTRSWWKSKLSSLGTLFKSRTRVYPLTPKAEADRTTPMVEMNRVSYLRMRSGPGIKYDQVETEAGDKRYFRKGDSFPVLQREGRWARVQLPDGGTAWAHTGYTRVWDEKTPIRDFAGATAVLNRIGE